MSRYIDSLPTPAHVEPKKLIVLSAPRTGTHGLYNALKLLGFKPYHMAEVAKGGPNSVKIMNDGIRGEMGLQKPYSRKDFDKWFADYDIIIEMPFFMLQSTLSAYPDAKFLLVERKPEKWAKSFENTIGQMHPAMNEFPGSLLKCFDGMAYHMGYFGNVTMNRCTKFEGMTDQGKKNLLTTYKEYITMVKRMVPRNQLKVMSLDDGFGWEEICPVMGVPVPKNLEWPGRNTPEEFHQMRGPMYRRAIQKSVVGFTTILGTIIAAGVLYRRVGGKLPQLSWV